MLSSSTLFSGDFIQNNGNRWGFVANFISA